MDNSHLSTWIRFGAIDGPAYVRIVVVGLLGGVRRHRVVDAAVLALALAFAAHQIFQSSAMVRWAIGSAIATLSVGFVAFMVSGRRPESATDDRYRGHVDPSQILAAPNHEVIVPDAEAN